MKQNMYAVFAAAMTFSLLATGCSAKSGLTQAEQPTAAATTEDFSADTRAETESVAGESIQVSSASEMQFCFDAASLFSDRDLSGDYAETAAIILDGNSAEISGPGATAEGSVITVTEEGVYRISGTLDDGQIIVNSDGKVQLVLDNASINCSDSSAIYIENAKKTFITLAEGSTNVISDGETYPAVTEEADEPDAAIFSKDSLTINGTGFLTVNGNFNNGITSKDDLVICSAGIEVNAAGHGIKGKDYVAATGAELTIHAGGDGIKSSNATDQGKGFVYIADGRFAIEVDGDGIQAESELVINGGEFSVTAGGGTANAKVHTNDFGMGGFGGRDRWRQDLPEEAVDAENTDVSVKGLKAGNLLYISGGTLDVEAADDTLHSNGALYTSGGSMTLRAGSKGMHADDSAEITGGKITVTESYEGIEARNILVSGGYISVTASDDGFNASDGSQQGAAGGAVDCLLSITGGTVYVNAEGDGLDSNGTIEISDGVVLVDGPTNSGNGALDANSTITCSGGLLIAAGSAGMAEYPSGSQNTIVLTSSVQQGGTLVTICNSQGDEILSYAPAKSWSSFVVSSPDLIGNETYTMYLGGSTTSEQKNGLYETGFYQNDGIEEGSVTLEEAVSFIGSAGGGMSGFGGRPGGGKDDVVGREFPEDMQPPTDENGEFSMPGGRAPGEFDPGNMEFPTDENGGPGRPDNGRGGGKGGFIPGGDRPNI